MESQESPARRFRAVSYEQDNTANIDKGALISMPKRFSPQSVSIENEGSDVDKLAPAFLLAPFLMLTVLFGFTPVGNKGLELAASLGSTMQQRVSAANTPVVVQNPYTGEQTTLNYGVQGVFAQPYFFNETRNAFVSAQKTFLEVDLDSMQVRYFDAGVPKDQYPVVSKAPIGSWCETPAGLYKVEFKRENHFSTFGQIYQPWSVGFQGNFFLHGTPQYSVGESVGSDFVGGCIRMNDADIEQLYKTVAVGTPVLVHEKITPSDAFVYQPSVPSLATPNYLIADVESNTILASSDLDVTVPIASLTKLMTALVATEYINLDTSVYVNQPTFVQSLIPRLGERSRVSMYSLMQLLLIESSNEASEVIAAQVGREEFIGYMNEMADRLGMKDTQFADPSGLSAGNVSSVRDLFQLSQYIYKHRRFIMDMTANQDLPTVYVSGEFGRLSNFNKVENLDNFIGGKIGETTAAGQTSVTLHNLKVGDTNRVVAVIVLGSNHRNQDVRQLLQYAEERFGR